MTIYERAGAFIWRSQLQFFWNVRLGEKFVT